MRLQLNGRKWQSRTLIFSGVLPMLMILSGCWPKAKAVLLEEGTTIRNAKKIQSEAWVPDKDGNPVKRKVEYPEGAGVTVPKRYLTELEFLEQAKKAKAEKK